MIDPPNYCNYDFDCEGPLKCCRMICGRDCVEPGTVVQTTAMLPWSWKMSQVGDNNPTMIVNQKMCSDICSVPECLRRPKGRLAGEKKSLRFSCGMQIMAEKLCCGLHEKNQEWNLIAESRASTPPLMNNNKQRHYEFGNKPSKLLARILQKGKSTDLHLLPQAWTMILHATVQSNLESLGWSVNFGHHNDVWIWGRGMHAITSNGITGA